MGVGPDELSYLHGYECEYDPIPVTVVAENNMPLKAVAYLYKSPDNLEDKVWDPKVYA